MSFSTAQIKDMLREILGIVKEINEKVDGEKVDIEEKIEEVIHPVIVEKIVPEVIDKKSEKRRIFLERMKMGRLKAKAKKGLPIL